MNGSRFEKGYIAMKLNINSIEMLSLFCVQNLWLSSATEIERQHQQGEPAKQLGCLETLGNEDSGKRTPWKTNLPSSSYDLLQAEFCGNADRYFSSVDLRYTLLYN